LLAVAVTETWLNKLNEDIFPMDGCSFISNCRQNKSVGGVGFYIGNNHKYNIRDDLCISNNIIECLFVEFPIPQKSSILLGVIYRPPNGEIKQFNHQLLNLLKIIDIGKYMLS